MEPAGQDEPRPHNWRISPREYARHESRRGRRHAFESLDPQRTALVVIDMVPFFAAENAHVRGIAPNVNALAGALRGAQGTVAWVLPATPSALSRWATEFYGPAVAAMYAASGGQGTMAERLWSGLDARPEDVWVEKSAASAFFPGRCPLPELLAAKGVDTVLVAGTVTSVCCESSARDASALGYRVVMVADANADVSDEPHNATLRTIYRSFGDVRPTAEILELIETGRRTRHEVAASAVGPRALLRQLDAVTVNVPDLDAGLSFYARVLGHRLRWRNDTLGQAGLALPDTDTELVLTTEHAYEPNWLVESVDDAVESFRRNGGTVLAEPRDIPVGRVAVVGDPFGNRLVLIDLSKGTYTTDPAGHVTGTTNDRPDV